MGSASCSPMRRRSWPSTSITALTNAGRSPRGPRPSSSNKLWRLCGAQLRPLNSGRAVFDSRAFLPLHRPQEGRHRMLRHPSVRHRDRTPARRHAGDHQQPSRRDALRGMPRSRPPPTTNGHVTPVPTVGATHGRLWRCAYPSSRSQAARSHPASELSDDDQTLLEKMFAATNGDRIRALWDGRWEGSLRKPERSRSRPLHEPGLLVSEGPGMDRSPLPIERARTSEVGYATRGHHLRRPDDHQSRNLDDRGLPGTTRHDDG